MVISCLDVYVILGCQLPIKLPLQAAMRGMTLVKMSVISDKKSFTDRVYNISASVGPFG